MPSHSNYAFLNEFRRYVPLHIQWLAHGLAAPLDGPRRATGPGAVLFFDVSGFTALTERYAQRGPAGIEALSALLNTYFGTLLTTVAEHGGDVTSFAGDAMLILWSDPVLSRAAERAALCGLAIQTRMAAVAADAAEKLMLKVVVDAGEATIVYIGGVGGRWDFYIGGSALAQVCAPDLKPVPGRVTLAPAVVRLLAARAVIKTLPGGWAHLERLSQALLPTPITPPPLPPAATAVLEEKTLRGFISGAICARIEAGQSNWLAELRQTTALFINLPGITADTPIEQAQEMFIVTQRVVSHYAGSVNQISIDDKGVMLVALCGLPPLTHEDDALRGTLAALDVHESLTRLSARVSIGIATGRLFSGTMGSQGRRIYALIGDVMNRAARLMQSAEGGILLDEATHQAARHRTLRGTGPSLHIEPLPPLQLKGMAEPVAVYRPSRAPTLVARTTTALIGRTAELGQLTAALGRLAAGESSTLIIEAEAGEGKSRLLEEVRAVARDRGIRAFHGAADAIETTTAYVAFRGLLSSLLGVDSVVGAEARGAAVRQRFAHRPELVARAPVLQDIVALGLLETEETRGLEGEGRAAAVRAAVVELLSAEAPLLLTVEDTQWFDSASWALLLSLASAVAPLLLVLTTRPVAAAAQSVEERELRKRPQTTLLRLCGLGPEHTAELVGARLGVDRVPEEVTRFIGGRTEGNAFFTEQLTLALRDSGLLEIKDGRCSVRPGVDLAAEASVPNTIEGVVTQRIDRLSPTEQLSLKVASVVGRVFSAGVVNDIFPIAELKGRLHPYLETVMQQGLTSPEGAGAQTSYLFRHIITQEVTYNLMLFSQRRELHRSVGHWYERNFADLAPYYPLLAHHFVQAEATEPAIDYLMRAGDQALAKYACEEAVRFFAEAARLDAARPGGADPRRQSRCAIAMGHAHYALARLDAAEADLRRGLAATLAPMPSSRLGLVSALVREVAVQLVRRQFPARFPRLVPEAQRRELWALSDTYHILSKIWYVRNDSLATAVAGLRSLELAQRAGPSAELAVALGIASFIADVAGMKSAAADYDVRARQMLQQVSEPSRRANAIFALSLHRASNCEWRSAAEGFEEVMRICEPLFNWRLLLQSLQGFARSHLRAGNLAVAAAGYQRMIELGRRVDDGQAVIIGLGGLVQSQLPPHNARWEERVGELREVLAAEARRDHVAIGDVAVARASIARALCRLGRYEEAEKEALLAGELTLRGGTVTTFVADALVWTAEVHIEQWKRSGDADGVRSRQITRLSDAISVYSKRYSFAYPLSRRIRAELRWLQGRAARAVANCEASLAAAQAREMPYDVARCHHCLGENLPADDSRRREHLDKARAIYQRLGTVYDLARLDALL